MLGIPFVCQANLLMDIILIRTGGNNLKTVNYLNISALRMHPRNEEFFDDMTGEEFERFKADISSNGIGSPLIVAPDMTLISGHQRYRAAKELGLETVPVIIDEDLNTEESKLERLIGLNFQRIKNDPAKQRKAVELYVELHGFKNGGDRKSEDKICLLKSQQEIADELGISIGTLKGLLTLERKLTPEVKELLDQGLITKECALKIWAKLPKIEQNKLYAEIGKDRVQEMSLEEMGSYADRITSLQRDKLKLEETVKKLTYEYKKAYGYQHENLKNKEELKAEILAEVQPTIVEKEVLVDNPELQKKIDRLEKEKSRLEREKKLLEEKAELNAKEVKEYDDLKVSIEQLTKDKTDLGREIEAVKSVASFIVDAEYMLKNQLAPIKYSRAIAEQSENRVVIKNVVEIVDRVSAWCDEMYKMVSNDKMDYIDAEVIE